MGKVLEKKGVFLTDTTAIGLGAMYYRNVKIIMKLVANLGEIKAQHEHTKT